MLFAYCQLEQKNGHQIDIQAIHPSRWDVHFIKSNIVMTQDQSNNWKEQLNSILD